MSIPFITNINLSRNEIQNVSFQKLATPPSTPSPTEALFYYNTVDKKPYYWNNTRWVAMDASESALADKDVTLQKMADMDSNTFIGRITQTKGVPEYLSVSNMKTILSYTKADVGLGDLTNDAQVKKTATSTNGVIPVWDGITGDKLKGTAETGGYTVQTTLESSETAIPRADAVFAAVNAIVASSDAMVFKGTLGVAGSVTELPKTHNIGWSYKVITAGTYLGHVCEVGDLIISLMARSGSANVTTDWLVVQANIDGAVTGPTSATVNNIATYNDISGKVVKDSGVKLADLAVVGHTHTGLYMRKFTSTLLSSTSQDFTHGLNTRDCTVTIRQTESPYAAVMADVEFTSLDKVTIKTAVAPAVNEYTITIIG